MHAKAQAPQFVALVLRFVHSPAQQVGLPLGADCTAVSAAAGSKDIMLHCRTTLHDKLARQSSLHVESSKSAHLLGSVPVTVSQPFVSSSGRQVV